MPDQQNDMQLAHRPSGLSAAPVRDPRRDPRVGDVWMVEPIAESLADWPCRIEVLDVNRIKVAFEVTRPEHATMRLIFRRPKWRDFVRSPRAYFIESTEGPARPPAGGRASNSAVGETGREQ